MPVGMFLFHENGWRSSNVRVYDRTTPIDTQGTAFLTSDQAQRLQAIQNGLGHMWTPSTATIQNNSKDGAATGAANGTEGGAKDRPGPDGQSEIYGGLDETVRVQFPVDEWLLADNDVVLTTYELLRSRSGLFRKVPLTVIFLFVRLILLCIL